MTKYSICLKTKKETKSWFQSLGKQTLPLGGNKFGFIRSVSQVDALVNSYGTNSSAKVSRELDLDYDENIEATQTLTNRDILVNALESATTSQVERYRFTTKPTPITKSLSRHRL